MKRLAGRIGGGVADQALSSATNFLMGVIVAHRVSISDFGAFNLAFAVYVVALGVSRAASTEPLLVRFSHLGETTWREGVRAATGVALAVAILLGSICVLVGVGLDGTVGSALVALGAVIPGLIVQDAYRVSFFALGRPWAAFLNDLVWGAGLLVVMIVLALAGSGDVASYLLAWGLTATLAAVVGGIQAKTWPDLRSLLRWLRTHHDLVPRYVTEFLVGAGAGQVGLFGVIAVAGLGAAGAFRAAGLLMGPLNVLFMGVTLVVIPEGVRDVREETAGLKQRSAAVSFVLGSVALGWGIVTLALPDSVGELILGRSWDEAQLLVFPIAVSMTGVGVLTGSMSGLRALAAARDSMRARLLTAPFFVFSVAGAALGGAEGAAWGSACGSLLSGGIWWYYFAKAERAHAEGAPARARE